jgi:Bacteriophage probable baseplate hub protein
MAEIVAYDPFAPTIARETLRRKAYCQINVGGIDVTNRLDPHLLSVTVILRADMYDEAHIEIDDRDGRLPIPPLYAPVSIALGWEHEGARVVFVGYISDIASSFGRKQGGRRLWVEAVSLNHNSGVKEPQQFNLGEGAPPGQQEGQKIPMSQAANEIFGKAGLSVRMSPRGQGVMRDYWYAMNESPMHWGQRMARELGMHFRIVGDQAIFTDNDESFGTVIARWSEGLISWHIYPFAARGQWGESNSQFFNFGQATWQIMTKMFGSEAPWNFAAAAKVLPHPAPNASVADQGNDGQQENSDAKRGSGNLVINGEPRAKPSMRVEVIGARPGVDGTYNIIEAHHIYSRQGYTTRLEVERPHFSGDGASQYTLPPSSGSSPPAEPSQ